MKKLVLPLLLFTAIEVLAQKPFEPKTTAWEAGLLLGLTNYSGDLAEKNIQFSENHLGYGAFARYFFSKQFSLKANLTSGRISGDDANSKDDQLRRRSFRFDANLLELGLVGEWHILGKDRFSSTGTYRRSISPYLYLGVGGTYSKSNVEYYGPSADLHKFVIAPLPEVPERQYFLLVPMGVGLRAALNEVLFLGLDLGCRPLFSDKLDGVRLNGNPDKKDWYYVGGVTISFTFGNPQKQV